MIIRAATAADTPRVVELVGHFIQQTAYRKILRFRPHKLTALIAKVLQIGVIFVAETDAGVVVGMLAACLVTEPVSGIRMVDELAWWVEVEHRGGTTGPKLLRALENWARQKECQIVKMVAPLDQPQVAEFYTRVGYEPVEASYMKKLR